MDFRELKNSQRLIFATPSGQHVEFKIDRTAFMLKGKVEPYFVRYELFSSGYDGTERVWDYLGVGLDLDQIMFWRIPEALKMYDLTGRGDGGRVQAPPTEADRKAAAESLGITEEPAKRANQATLDIRRAARREEAKPFLNDYGNGEISYEALVEFLTDWAQVEAPVETKDRRRRWYQEGVAPFGQVNYLLPVNIRKIELTFRDEDALWEYKIFAKPKGKAVTSKVFVAVDPLEGWVDARTWAADIK